MRDQLGIIVAADEVETLASTVPDAGGVYFIPAFSGLFAPYWRSDARGTIVGLSRASTRAHLARATLEAICYQTRDVLLAMEQDVGLQLEELKVDGGITANRLCMQLQADILGLPVSKPAVPETTALGAAYAAGSRSGTGAAKTTCAGTGGRQSDGSRTGAMTDARPVMPPGKKQWGGRWIGPNRRTNEEAGSEGARRDSRSG